MTIQYSKEVLNAGALMFLKLLFRWKGGIIKLVFWDLVVFFSLYSMITSVYRFCLTDESRRLFEKIIKYVYKSQSLIPLAFMLGFYVSLVFKRFWKHFNTIPTVTKLAIIMSNHWVDLSGTNNKECVIRSDVENSRLQKRSIIRYLVASLVLTLSRVSVPVKRRFPTIDELHFKGILLKHEVDIIKAAEPITIQPFLPIAWSTAVVMTADKQGRFPNDSVCTNTIKEINKFRQQLQELFLLDQVSIPLLYTQVVILAAYSYFLSCLISRQFIIDKDSVAPREDFIVPIITILQFFIYIGWMKLAMELINPMGVDDEDFDLNRIIDYHFETSLNIIDCAKINQNLCVKDKFFNKDTFELPMQKDSPDTRSRIFTGSVYNMTVDSDTLKSVTIPSEINFSSNVSKTGSHIDRRIRPVEMRRENQDINLIEDIKEDKHSSSLTITSTSSKGFFGSRPKLPKTSTEHVLRPFTGKQGLLVIKEEERSSTFETELKPLSRNLNVDPSHCHSKEISAIDLKGKKEKENNDN